MPLIEKFVSGVAKYIHWCAVLIQGSSECPSFLGFRSKSKSVYLSSRYSVDFLNVTTSFLELFTAHLFSYEERE
jgi:hypothetical protein